MAARRNSYLDNLGGRGIKPEFYDPEGKHFGIPTYPYHFAPKGLLTRRQLRTENLSPGGHDPAAEAESYQDQALGYEADSAARADPADLEAGQ